jgi:hypothetical protein
MRNWILSALVLIVAIGCATALSINSKSRYVSTEYGFSAEIPEGWIRYDDLNDAKRQAIGSLIKPEGRLVLADSSSNRIIVASGYRNSDCWSSLKLDLFDGVPVCFKDQITKSITKTIEEEINPAHYSLDVSPSRRTRGQVSTFDSFSSFAVDVARSKQTAKLSDVEI